MTAPPEFGVRVVVPVLEALARKHPELGVELSLGTDLGDLDPKDIDVAIRTGALRESSLASRRIGRVPRGIVGAPCHLRARGEPRRLAGPGRSARALGGCRFRCARRSRRIVLDGSKGPR